MQGACRKARLRIVVAVTIIMAMRNSAHQANVISADRGERSSQARVERAVRGLAAVLRRTGWEVDRELTAPTTERGPDLIARRGGVEYLAEVKVAPEGRADRLVPLWSQACLQAMQWAAVGEPLVIVGAPRISASAAEQVLEFAGEYAPHVAAGVIDLRGLRRFRGRGLDELDADPPRGKPDNLASAGPADAFSDLNQWLLKVLLAPEIPAEYLSAPRDRYRNASHLAEAAGVSVASAYRFARWLASEGYLDESSRSLRLVRRESLFRRWRSAASLGGKETPVRLLLGGDRDAAAALLTRRGSACLGLFAAADAHKLGFVHGATPYVLVRNLADELGSHRNLGVAERHEVPDLVLRQPTARESVFRAAVEKDGIHVSDIVQVWLDVSMHPTRGEEQADLIWRRVLRQAVTGEDAR